MENNPISSILLLPDMHIENFRGISNLSIPRLGRVTLLAGRNGVGKSTVLEAIRVYASRARYTVLRSLLTSREEFSTLADEDGDRLFEPDWGALFYGRDPTTNSGLVIGSTQGLELLSIEVVGLRELSGDEIDSLSRLSSDSFFEGGSHTLRAKFFGDVWIVPVLFFPDRRMATLVGRVKRSGIFPHKIQGDKSKQPPPETCVEVGAGLLGNYELSQFWDNVALTEDENLAIQALNLVYGDAVERVAMVGGVSRGRTQGGRRAVVRLKGDARPVPLRSLGEGALRMFGIALALANSRDGFLLIDEAENGIHHSVQPAFWRMVLQTARENNVQVFATTHSRDCVRGFAVAADANEDVEGVLVRLEKEEDEMRAVRYSERRLKIAAEQNIEVR